MNCPHPVVRALFWLDLCPRDVPGVSRWPRAISRPRESCPLRRRGGASTRRPADAGQERKPRGAILKDGVRKSVKSGFPFADRDQPRAIPKSSVALVDHRRPERGGPTRRSPHPRFVHQRERARRRNHGRRAAAEPSARPRPSAIAIADRARAIAPEAIQPPTSHHRSRPSDRRRSRRTTHRPRPPWSPRALRRPRRRRRPQKLPGLRSESRPMSVPSGRMGSMLNAKRDPRRRRCFIAPPPRSLRVSNGFPNVDPKRY